jgi:hypothetical protein
MSNSQITGGCYCGAIRYTADQEPISLANCHCANCRKAAGAQAVAWITVPRSSFTFEKGNPARYTTETGALRTFCSTCGTSLTYERDTRPGEIDITTGSLDEPEKIPAEPRCVPRGKIVLGRFGTSNVDSARPIAWLNHFVSVIFRAFMPTEADTCKKFVVPELLAAVGTMILYSIAEHGQIADEKRIMNA